MFLAVAIASSLLGLQLYSSLNFSGQVPSLFLALGYSTLYMAPFLPVVVAVAVGDTLAIDATSGYLACLLMRVGLATTLRRRAITTALTTAGILLLSLVPAAAISVAAYPAIHGLLPGALERFPAPEWGFTAANIATLMLAGAAWGTVVTVVAPLLLPGRYWILGAPVALYLLLSLTLPPAFSPMRRADLWFYLPSQGGFWTDAAWWAGWLLVGGVAGSLAWFRKGDLLA